MANNRQIIRGLNRYGRAISYHHKGIWAKKAKAKAAKKAPGAGAALAAASSSAKARAAKVVKKVTKQFQKGTRQVVRPRPSRFYPTERAQRPVARHFTPRTAVLRKSIVPGTVLVLLAGRHRGKRVIFLKQLPSGLLLVTGPYAINGVPLRRVNQAYVIATKTRVDVSKIKLDAKFNDAYFKRPERERKQKSESEFFAQEKKKREVPSGKKDDQKSVDSQLLAVVKNVKNLKKYLGAKFTLTNGQFPHKMAF